MPTVTKPYGDFVNNLDVADATKVNGQINALYNAINGNLDAANVKAGTFLKSTGDTMTGDLTMDAAGVAASSYSRKIFLDYVDSGGTKHTDRYVMVNPSGSLIYGQSGVRDDTAIVALSGGSKVQSGSTSIASTAYSANTYYSSPVINFPVSFGSTPIVVPGLNGLPPAGTMVTFDVEQITVNSFKILFNFSAAYTGPMNFSYIAIGS